jgi:glycosyltransferase involved in cell wall biosynthesis
MSRVSLNWYQEQVAMLRIAERYFLHRTVAVAIANSRAVLRELGAEGIPESKLRLVHNGIDSRAFARALLDRQTARAQLGIGGAGLVMSVVANLHTYQGHMDLLVALSGIRERLPPHWTLLAVGADIAGSMALLRRRTAELGLSGQVRFLGQRSSSRLCRRSDSSVPYRPNGGAANLRIPSGPEGSRPTHRKRAHRLSRWMSSRPPH